MTILTSVTVCAVWHVSLTPPPDALSDLFCEVFCLVLDPLQAGQFVPCPRKRCNLKARRLSEFQILLNPTISVLSTPRWPFLRPAPTTPFPLMGRFCSELPCRLIERSHCPSVARDM